MTHIIETDPSLVQDPSEDPLYINVPSLSSVPSISLEVQDKLEHIVHTTLSPPPSKPSSLCKKILSWLPSSLFNKIANLNYRLSKTSSPSPPSSVKNQTPLEHLCARKTSEKTPFMGMHEVAKESPLIAYRNRYSKRDQQGGQQHQQQEQHEQQHNKKTSLTSSSTQKIRGHSHDIFLDFMSIMTKILGQVEAEAHALYQKIKHRTDQIDTLNDLLGKINCTKGAIDWTNNTSALELIQQAKAIGVDIPNKTTWTEEEKKLLKENIQIKKDSLEKISQLERTDMQRFLQEAAQCHQARSNVLKLMKEVMDTITHNFRSS